MVRLTLPVECKATALSWFPCRRASRNAEHTQSQALQMLTVASFLMLYVAGSIFDGHCTEHVLHTHTPQFLQWLALRKTANCDSQMKQPGFDSKECIKGGAHALANALACFSEGTEKALSAFELSCTLFASSAFWFVLTVATDEFVVDEYITEEGSRVRGRIDPLTLSKSKPDNAACRRPPDRKRVSITLFAPRAKLDDILWSKIEGSGIALTIFI